MKISPRFAAVLAFGMGLSAMAQTPAAPDKPKDPQPPAAKPDAGKPVEAKPDVAKQDENLPTAEALFDKHIAAVGGAEALKTEKNRLVRAKIQTTGQVGEGALRVLRVAPNKFYQTLEFPGVVTLETWCNGEEAWVRDSNRGTVKAQGDELAEIKRQADFMGEANYKARYKELKTTGHEMFGEVDAYLVHAVPTHGKERTLYFDVKNGFLIGMRTPGAAGPESDQVTTLSEYKKFGEIMHPTKNIQRMGRVQSTITVMQIESNLTMMPSVEPPDEVRAVK